MTHCPYCDHAVQTVTALKATTGPKAGDLMICEECFRWTVFDDEMQLRKPNGSEARLIASDPRYELALKDAIAKVRLP